MKRTALLIALLGMASIVWAQQGGQTSNVPPLTGTAAQPQNLDEWPVGKLDPEDYRGAIEERFRAILKAATPPTKWLKLASWAGGLVSDGLVADKVIAAMNDYLSEAQLA